MLFCAERPILKSECPSSASALFSYWRSPEISILPPIFLRLPFAFVERFGEPCSVEFGLAKRQKRFIPLCILSDSISILPKLAKVVTDSFPIDQTVDPTRNGLAKVNSLNLMHHLNSMFLAPKWVKNLSLDLPSL